jgi:hypothetical protein
LPPLAASFRHHRRSAESCTNGPRMYCADCTRSVRREWLPVFVMPHCGFESPGCCCRGLFRICCTPRPTADLSASLRDDKKETGLRSSGMALGKLCTSPELFSVNYSFALTTVISPYERHLPPSTADDILVELG